MGRPQNLPTINFGNRRYCAVVPHLGLIYTMYPASPAPARLFPGTFTTQCDYLQEKPNPLASARLALADRDAPSTAINGTGNNVNGYDSPSSLVQPRDGMTLNLESCRLTDREARVLLHVLSKWCADDESATAATGEGASPAEEAITAQIASVIPSRRFSTLLLGGNPGIGAGALREIWAGGSSNSSRADRGLKKSLGLFRSLVRLDISRCGLTAADLAGFPSRGVGGGVGSGSGSGPSSSGETSVCLRALVLRDNPLTRIREGNAGGGDRSWIEPAQRGAAALRDLIARAPALELLDLSGEE